MQTSGHMVSMASTRRVLCFSMNLRVDSMRLRQCWRLPWKELQLYNSKPKLHLAQQIIPTKQLEVSWRVLRSMRPITSDRQVFHVVYSASLVRYWLQAKKVIERRRTVLVRTPGTDRFERQMLNGARLRSDSLSLPNRHVHGCCKLQSIHHLAGAFSNHD